MLESGDTLETQRAQRETELVLRHGRGEPDAFAQLMHCYRAPVRNYLLRCGIDAATCDDLLQEIFAKIHAAAGDYQPHRPVRAWIFTIAANTARSHFRHRKVEQRLFAGGEVERGVGDELSSLSLAQTQETLDWLATEAAGLPLPQREVLVLCCIEQLEQREVAEILAMPVATVKTHLRRARLQLAKALARRRLRTQREARR